MMGVLDMTLVSIATGLVVSAIWLYVVWGRVRRPGESWEEARKRELAHLDRLAVLDAKREGAIYARAALDARNRLNAELAEIPDTVRSFEDRSIN